MGEDQEFQIRAKVNDIMGTVEIEGAPEPELFYKNMRFQSAQEPELRQVSAVMRNSPADSPQFEQAKARQTELLDERKAHLEEIFRKYPDAFFTTFKRSGQNPDFVNYYKPNGDMDTLRQVVDYEIDSGMVLILRMSACCTRRCPENKLKRYIKDLTPQNRDSLLNVADALIQKVLPYKPYFQFFSQLDCLAV
ncbi:MAG: hypothetical protein R2792_16810 [Saprospiraceae bacterium]